MTSRDATDGPGAQGSDEASSDGPSGERSAPGDGGDAVPAEDDGPVSGDCIAAAERGDAMPGDAGDGLSADLADTGPPAPSSDGGARFHEGPRISGRLQVFGPESGLPAGDLRSVTQTEAGHVAVTAEDGLYLMPAGTSVFRRHSVAEGLRECPDPGPSGGAPCRPLSVAGLPGGDLVVGYLGVWLDPAREDDDPPAYKQSGDADRFRITAEGRLQLVMHYDITPDPTLPDPLERVRTVHAIVPVTQGPFAGDIWFGGNHGVAQFNGRFQIVQQHRHSYLGFWDGQTWQFQTGDFYGVALDPAGDVWMGGSARTAVLRYASQEGAFWAPLEPVGLYANGDEFCGLDLWPDDATYSAATRDRVSAMTLGGDGWLWVGSGEHGLLRLDPTTRLTDPLELPDGAIHGLLTDESGGVWVATAHHGLFRFDPHTGERRQFGPPEGLPADGAFGLALGIADAVVAPPEIGSAPSSRPIWIAGYGFAAALRRP